VLGPGHAGEMIQPEGPKASALNERLRAMLLDVISEWAGIINDTYAAPRIEEIKAAPWAATLPCMCIRCIVIHQ